VLIGNGAFLYGKKGAFMGSYEEGFALYLQNQGVVHRAVQVAGVQMGQQDYEEYIAEGRLLYAQYCNHYYDGLDTPAELKKFNKLAFNYISKSVHRICKQRWRTELQHDDLERLVVLGEEPAAAGDVEQDVLALGDYRDFFRGLNSREQQVLNLVLTGYTTNRLIAAEMGISPSYVGKLRRLLRTKFIKMGGD
jgi:DNA-binding NarL/FixJ family response regulator